MGPDSFPTAYICIYRVFGWIRNPVQNRVPNPTNLCTGFGWIRNWPQILAYKHEMHFGGPFWDVHMKKSSDSDQTCFRLKMMERALKLRDWSKGMLVQSIGVNPPVTI